MYSSRDSKSTGQARRAFEDEIRGRLDAEEEKVEEDLYIMPII
jgi:hypothetical protein